MSFINWQQFGLKRNPYDTVPLIEGGDLPIDEAFVGRNKERDFLNNLFESETRLCLTVCGDVGVGKTSLANYHKYVWKSQHAEKKLFSFRREIEANEDLLNKKTFLLEIIGSIIREIRLLDPNLLEENDLLKRLNSVIDISQTISFSAGGSAFGFGGDYGRDENLVQPIQIAATIIEDYFRQLLDLIRDNKIAGTKYEGLIVHVNNFDVVIRNEESKKKVIKFFSEIRDVLQTPNVYFLFLGPKNFFKEIITKERRVSSIFSQTPLILNPLSKSEIIQAFEERMKLFKSEDVVAYINPFEDEVISRLYDIYQGDIRSIMSSLRDVLNQCSDKLAKNLSVDEAMVLLAKELWEQIEMNQLTEEQKAILKIIVQLEEVAQRDIAKMLNKAQTNISGYYFKPLNEAGIIEEKRQEGSVKYWGLTQKYIPLKYSLDSQSKLTARIEEKSKQLSLFK